MPVYLIYFDKLLMKPRDLSDFKILKI